MLPVRDGAATLGACLSALQDQTGPLPDWEIIVVDHGSSDGSGTVASDCGAAVVTCEGGSSYRARNRGAQYARGEVYAFLDADSVPAPDWLRRLDAAFRDGIAALQGSSGGRNANRIGQLVQWEYEALFRRDVLINGSRAARLDTRNCAISAGCFDELGGFDESFRYWGDADLGNRVRAAGGEIRFAPEMRIEHLNLHSLSRLRKKYRAEGMAVTDTLRSKGRRFTQANFPLFSFVHLPQETIAGKTVDLAIALRRFESIARRRAMLITALAPLLPGRPGLRVLRGVFGQFHDANWRIGSIGARSEWLELA